MHSLEHAGGDAQPAVNPEEPSAARPRGDAVVFAPRPVPASAEDVARRLYDIAVRRTAALGADLFSDPAWLMLLDLYLSEAKGERLCVTAVCAGSCSSSSTALRYVGLLQRNGLIVRHPDERDGRRSYVQLTARAREALTVLLESAARPLKQSNEGAEHHS